MKRKTIFQAMVTAGLALLLASPIPAFATNDGHIVSLTLAGAHEPGECIHIHATVQADSDLSTSNMYYQLFAPSGSRVTTADAFPPSLNNGQTFSDSWRYCNPPEDGTYTVTLCWSTGNNNHNCNIDRDETSASSIPTLGTGLGLTALAGLGVFLYRRRAVFQRRTE